jgi:hypothetical protein
VASAKGRGLLWRPFHVAGTTAANQDEVTSAASVDGLWSVTLRQAAGNSALWTLAYSEPSGPYVAAFRLRDFTFPAAVCGVRWGLTAAHGGTPSVGTGWDQVAGGATLSGGALESDTGLFPATARASADVRELAAMCVSRSGGQVAHGHNRGTTWDESAYAISTAGGLATAGYVAIEIITTSLVDITVGFRPEYAIVQLP